MTLVILGQLLGLSFACALNLYLTVAALGLLSRYDLVRELPVGLQGLEGWVVIGSALTLFAIEAIVDKLRHADSLWDTVHTFIRPPAAALLAVGALWTAPLHLLIAGAALSFLVALAVHGTKAGIRLSLNTRQPDRGHAGISALEDVAAVAFAVAAVQYPIIALAATALLLVLILLFGPRFWRAFGLGLRCLASWLRALFSPSRWRELDHLPRGLRALFSTPSIGAAPNRSTRAGLHGLEGIGPYRNGWLVVTSDGPSFAYRRRFQARRVDLPVALDVDHVDGVWADILKVTAADASYTIYLLKDGPAVELAVRSLRTAR